MQEYTFKSIAKLAGKHRKTLVAANLIAVLAVIASVPIPLLIPLLVDEVLLDEPGRIVGFFDSVFNDTQQGPIFYITAVLAITVVLRVLALILNVWQTKKFVLVSKDIVYAMRAQMLARLERITMSEYETVGSGAVSSLFVTDLNTIDQFIGETASKVIISALTILGVGVILVWLHWQLALFILLMNPIVIYFTMMLGKRVKELKKSENKSFEIFQQALTETLDGIQQIRASNREKFYLSQVRKLAANVRDHSTAFSWKSDSANRISFLIFLVGFDVFRAVGMAMVLLTGLSIGEMIAVFGYLWFMMGPVQEVLAVQYSYFSAKAALTRINSLIQLPDEPIYPTNQNPFKYQHGIGIDIDNIEFAYGDGPSVLNGVNLSIKEGEKVALVGASGGGKSTLVQVLLGLYPPVSGDIRFNQCSITQIGMDVVRENVACVLQHPTLFNDSLRNNLTLGRDATDDQLWQVLRVAQMEEVVKQLPEGLDSILGRNGVRLSGGQRQRIAVARMALTDPKVVILDEATSALDADTEARLHQSLQTFLKGRTTIIIAHRLSAVRQADRVFVFDNGKVVENGHHQELIGARGLYARLYGQQYAEAG